LFFNIAENSTQTSRGGPFSQHTDGLKDGDSGAAKGSKLLVEQQEIIRFHTSMRS
jgi:hypothetical protein